MTHPYIEFEHVKYYEVGCRKCSKAGYWQVFSDGEFFVAKHYCGNVVKLAPSVLVNNPD